MSFAAVYSADRDVTPLPPATPERNHGQSDETHTGAQADRKCWHPKARPKPQNKLVCSGRHPRPHEGQIGAVEAVLDTIQSGAPSGMPHLADQEKTSREALRVNFEKPVCRAHHPCHARRGGGCGLLIRLDPLRDRDVPPTSAVRQTVPEAPRSRARISSRPTPASAIPKHDVRKSSRPGRWNKRKPGSVSYRKRTSGVSSATSVDTTKLTTRKRTRGRRHPSVPPAIASSSGTNPK